MASVNKKSFEYDPHTLPNGENFKFHLVVCEWNKTITYSLSSAAIKTLLKAGVKEENILIWSVPGSFELIYGSKKAQKNNPNAVIAIGSIIQGQTKHFEYICQAVTHGIKDLNVKSDVPVIFCVLTDYNIDQAKARSGGKYGNKGVEAAITALKMAELVPNPKLK